MAFSVRLLTENSESQIEENYRITSNYNRSFLYRTDSATRPTEVQIVTDIGIVPGSPYPNDANATCHAVSIGPGPAPTRPPHLAYIVKVKWSTRAPVPNNTTTDPTTKRTVWSLKPTIQTRYIVKDRNNVMILNSAGQPFDGGIPVAVRLATAVAKKNRTAVGYNQNTVLAHSGKLNSTTFLGAAPKTIQVDIEAEEIYEGGFHYWSEVYTFAYDPLGWQPKPMDAGFFQRSSAGSATLRRIKNSDLETGVNTDPVQEPEPLLENGLMVPVASRPGSCRFIEVDAYELFDMNSFGL